MKLPDFLTEVDFGAIRVTGHRIDLYHVMDYYNQGHTPEQIHEDLPTLSVELIEKVLAFAQANKAEVDAYVAEYDAQVERLIRENPPRVTLEELWRRMEQIDPEWVKRNDPRRKG